MTDIIISRIERYATREGFCPSLAECFLSFFKLSLVRALLPTLAAGAISFVIATHEFPSGKSLLAKLFHSPLLIFLVISLCIMQLCFYIADRSNICGKKDYNSALYEKTCLNKILNWRILDFFNMLVNLASCADLRYFALKYKEYTNYPMLCEHICKSLYDMIKARISCENHEIGFYVRDYDDKSDPYIRMLAWATKNDRIPVTHDKMCYIDEKRSSYLKKIFADNRKDAAILKSKREVIAKLQSDDISKERINQIHQCIAIPIFLPSSDSELACLLRIDIDIKNGFGKTEQQIKSFIHTHIQSYADLLLMGYLQYVAAMYLHKTATGLSPSDFTAKAE